MDEDTPYDIAIARVCGRASGDYGYLTDAVRRTLRRHETPAAQIGIALVDDPHIAKLNQTHLNHTGPTDVIAFDLRDDEQDPIEGEIVVSIDTAAREATARGHGIEAELMLYVIHGTLHLLGYDDHTEQDAKVMHETEDDILTTLGVGPTFKVPTR